MVSTKKEELTNILDHCGVQVDNPVSLLNQDTSRHFLQKSKPGDKYKLFMKATRLEQIATDYEKAEQDQRIMKEAISKQRSVCQPYYNILVLGVIMWGEPEFSDAMILFLKLPLQQ